MKANFLRNCNSKGEYLFFKENYPEYFESYNIIVGKTVKFTKEKLFLLDSNTLCKELWETTEVKNYISDDETALCIKVVNCQNKTHSYVFFNGYKYAKYIAYV